MGWRKTGMVELVWLGCAVDALMSPTIRRRRFGGARMHEHVAKETETVTEYYYW
jgi:hypothetical protein